MEVISDQECQEIVKNYIGHNNFKILDYKLRPFGENVDGFLGEHISILVKLLDLNNKIERDIKFFAKRFPFGQELMAQYCMDVNAFIREMDFYERVLKQISEDIPNCDLSFTGKYCFGRKNDIVVFEDITAKGYTMVEQANSGIFDDQHIKLALKALAKFHTTSFAYEETNQNKKVTDLFSVEIFEPIFSTPDSLGFKYLVASFKGLSTLIDERPQDEAIKEEFKEKLIKLRNDISFKLNNPNKSRNILCHGDLWANNFMFKYNNGVPVDCKLVDFQLLKYCSPAFDVLFLIFMTTDRKVRQYHFHDFIYYYYNCLQEQLSQLNLDINTIWSKKQFKEAIDEYLPVIKLNCANQVSMIGGNSEYMKKLTAEKEEFKKFVFEDRSPYIKELYRDDENYRMLLDEALLELKEVLFTPEVSVEDCFELINNYLGSENYELIDLNVDINLIKVTIIHNQEEKKLTFPLKKQL